MRVLICGSRNWPDPAIIRDDLSKLPADTVVIHGDAKGADRMGQEAALGLGMGVQTFPADWSNLDAPNAVVRRNTRGHLYNVRAGVMRNQRMLDEGQPDLVLAYQVGFSEGTADMIRRAEAAGVPTFVLRK